MPRRLSLALLVFVALPAVATAAPPNAATIDAIFADALKTYPVPGLVVGVVRGDEVVYLKGYGVRELGGKDAVTPDTVFSVGSCTKAFTATAIGLLVEDGKASWDDPVRKHVPYFHLSDPLADRDVTLRDLLCHRTGLSRHDMLYYRASWGVEETVRRVAGLELHTSFRSTYEYNNLCYMAAGLAVEGAAKQPWQDVVQKRLFDRLGMNGAVFTKSAALKAADHATPHRIDGDGKPQAMEWYPDDSQVRASGSLKAGARDLTKWLRMQLNDGVYDGKRIVSARTLAETHSPQMVMPTGVGPFMKLTETTQASYGMGWIISDYRGHVLWEHGGAVDGFRAKILLAPKDKIGVVVLGNSDQTEATLATSYQVLDHMLGLEKRDWNGYYTDLIKRATAAAKAKREQFDAGRKADAKPSRDLDAYAGTFEDAAYGTLTVVKKDGSLRLSWSSFEGRLAHYREDTFSFAAPGKLEDTLAAFVLNGDKDVTAVKFLDRTFQRVKPR
jgi:CubicO group peptidase (beta-lactamase class C family)